jgi:alanyl aminopeptidase
MGILAALASAATFWGHCTAPLAAPSETAKALPALRIPEGSRPLGYAVTLTVVPGEATVHGEIAIEVELAQPQSVLWLNADDVTVTRAVMSDSATAVEVLPHAEQFVGLAFRPALPAGRHRLTLDFEAPQTRDSARGIFALEQGGAWYAMTQFEALSARRAFPCFDEPQFKVPWQLTLRVPHALVALSNTPVVSRTEIGNGLDEVRFAQTRPLPSYLIAFAVGPWETVDIGTVGANPTPLRIVVPRGRAADAAFVARAYPQIFARLERWFGIPYAYRKLDQVAIPLSVGFAMENVGLITYGVTNLLARPGADTPLFRHIAASVGAHEMSHQWFGDLVTMAWWDDIWLNEAFATWLATKMVDAWQPAYEHGAGRSHERAQAIEEDMLSSARQIREPIVNRGDIFNAFDAITYEKGATVIGMFEGWIGEERFRRGVRDYLQAHRDGNATAADFLGALGSVGQQPVAPAFSTFLDQNGVPKVEVALECRDSHARLALAQSRLVPLGGQKSEQRWQVPVCARYGDDKATRQTCTLLGQASGDLALDGGCPAFVIANAGGRGYYVADYRSDLLERLAAHREALSPAEYASLLYDVRALLASGSLDGAQALAWFRAAGGAKDRHVTEAAVALGRFVRDTLVADDERAQFTAFVRAVYGARAHHLGYAPRSGESDDDQLVRRSLLRFVAPEDSALAAEARRLARAWLADRRAVDPTMVDSVLLIAAETGDAPLFDAMLAAAKSTRDSLERRNLMVALFSFGDPALARRGMGIVLDPAFDVRESTTALRISARSIPPRRETHDFIAANFDAFTRRVPHDAPARWPEYAAGLCSADDARSVEAFWRDRITNYAGGARELEQVLEQIRACARLRAAQQHVVSAFLTRH